MRLLLFLFLPVLFSCSSDFKFKNIDRKSIATLNLGSSSWELEEFVLGEKQSMLDILILVDTSESMYHRLEQLGHSLLDLLSVISDKNWQIGITSADHGDHKNPSQSQDSWRDHMLGQDGRFGGLMRLENGIKFLDSKILNSSTPGYADVFLHSLSHGSKVDCQRPPYCQARLEQPLRALKSAMQRSLLDNAYFFRPEADLVSLIITNEEERAEDRQRATSASQVVQTFNKVFGNYDKKYIAFNILVKDKNCLAQEKAFSDQTEIAFSIAELADITGGYNIDLCSQSYGQELRQLSQYIKNTLENSIVLNKEPVSGTVDLEFSEGSSIAWEQYGRNIIFKKRSPGLVAVSVSYKSLK